MNTLLFFIITGILILVITKNCKKDASSNQFDNTLLNTSNEEQDYRQQISKPNIYDNRVTSIEVDEGIGKVYNLIKDRIGKDNCTFLSPVEDNSEIIDELDHINESLKTQFSNLTPKTIDDKLESLDFNSITEYVEARKSGNKGKDYYLNNENEPCCTEEIAKEYYNSADYVVIRAELDFWQIIFCLLFFEEIYCKYWDVLSDIPFDYFNNSFYFVRKDLIKAKIEKISKCENLKDFIIAQYNDFGKFPSRLLYPFGKNYDVTILDYDEITRVFDYIPKNDIIKIMERYAQNPNLYRSGTPDLIIYNDNSYCLVEVKRLKEKIRVEQADWISYLKKNEVPVKILRVKGI